MHESTNRPAIRLSICIPTHHGRLKYLGEAIESVVSQLTPEFQNRIEICVSDNASEDGTRELIEHDQQKHPGLFVYSRNESDRGLCYNLLKVVEIAHGDYCWYLSSDDQIASSGIGRVLEILEQYPDTAGMAVHLALYDLKMEKEIAQMPEMLQPYDREQLRVFCAADEAFEKSLLFQGHMSQVIFNRKLWRDIVNAEGIGRLMYYRYFEHVYIIGRMLMKHPQWLSCPEKLIKVRSNNASTLLEHQGSILRYHLQTVEDRSRVLSDLIGKPDPRYKAEMYKAYKAFCIHSPAFTIARYKLAADYRPWDDLALPLRYAKYWYFVPRFWYRTFPALLFPRIFVKIVVGIRNRLKMRTRVMVLRQRLYKALQELRHWYSI